jgi:hypothetical protein
MRQKPHNSLLRNQIGVHIYKNRGGGKKPTYLHKLKRLEKIITTTCLSRPLKQSEVSS